MLTLALVSLAFADSTDAAPAPAPAPAPATFSEAHPPAVQKYDGVRHGFRAGYVYVNQAETLGLRDPSLFAIGYEAEFKVIGDKGLDFVIVPNVMVLGLNQGTFIPTSNALIGLSFNDTFKVGVGGNVTPNFSGSSWFHMVAAAEYAPSVGKLQLPIALSYIPDVDGNWRVGATVGVNWPKR